MYAGEEARFSTARSLIDKALSDNTSFDIEDRNRFAKLAVGEITHDQLMAQSTAKAKRIETELAGLRTAFLEKMAKARVATLGQLNRQLARELRAVVRKMAALLHFEWNGRFLEPAVVLEGYTPQGVPFCFGEGPCPEFLILTFQSSLVEGPNGRRTAIVYAIETMQQVFDVIFSALTGSGSRA